MKNRIVLGGILTIAMGGIPACADYLFVNSSWVTLQSSPTTVANISFRPNLNTTAWDQAINNAQGSPVSVTQERGVNNANRWANTTYNFVLQHFIAGGYGSGGFVFTLSGVAKANPNDAGDTVVSWGQFPGGTTTGTTAATLGGLAPPAVFESLLLTASVGGVAGASLTFSNLSFSGPGLILLDGSFVNGTVNTGGSTPAGAGSQRIVSDGNLGASNWTLSGTIDLVRPNGGTDDSILFHIAAQDGDFTIVPEPGVPALVGLALLVLGFSRRRAS